MSAQSVVTEPNRETDEDRLARILDDYLVAVEHGERVTPETILARYPDDADKLRGYLSGLNLFHAAVAPTSATPAPPITMASSGRRIGDYQLIREIGRGGMGVVYEALQLSLHRRVALKLLPFTAASDAKQIGRFKNEAQAAAQVQHPNIVPVFMIGEEAGVHFYAMQLIEGQSLTALLADWRGDCHGPHDSTARNNTLTRRDGQYRVESAVPVSSNGARSSFSSVKTSEHVRFIARLGIEAAQALHAAHEYGVIHRDIKPSNLLLGDQQKLWITDFGLARCRADSDLTQTGDILGTMRYMSPEQAHGQHEQIDRRSDIYSLGVTLYELATLHHPAEGVSDIQLYFHRGYRSPKPLRQWNRHIPVDFQTIVLKAMAESPHERYANAQELADDLHRFLEGKPILATPPSWWMRGNKWLKRHRRAVSAAATLLIIASMALSFVFARQKSSAERNLAQLVTSWHQAYAAFDRLAQLGDQLAAIPGAEGVQKQLYEDLLGLSRQFQQQAINDPALAADIALAYSKSGSLFEKLDDKQRALESHRMALRIWKERVASQPSNPDYARNLALCQNNLGLLLAELNDTGQARGLLTHALEMQDHLRTIDPQSDQFAADAATTHCNLGLVFSQSGETEKATREFQSAIALAQPLTDSGMPSEAALHTLAASYNNLGSLFDAQNIVDAAEAYRKAIDIQTKLVETHKTNRLYQGDLARTYDNLGFLAARAVDWQKAAACYGDAIELQENLVKSSPLAGAYRRDLAISLNNLGMAQSHNNLSADAENSFRKAVQLQDMLLTAQPDDATTLSNQGSALNNLGLALDKERRCGEAEGAFRKAVLYQAKAIHRSPTNEHYRDLLSQHYDNFAKNLRAQSKAQEASQIAAERTRLSTEEPDILYSAAQQLATAKPQ